MEDVLEVYTRPLDPARPMVCLDEPSKQLVAESRPGMACKPGRRHVRVRERRTRVDFADVIRELCDELYPDAERLVLVMDQLNTHNIASLYEAFAPEEAKRLANKLEIHYTPKHGSWLNMAEIELSILSRQCMRDYFESRHDLAKRISAWEHDRNKTKAGIDWRFTTDDARIKLKRLYPVK